MNSKNSDSALTALYDEVCELYLADKRPWVLGFSGGKDSTCALQIVWSALERLPNEKRTKTVYVISSDTLVETPVIVNYIDQTLKRIEHSAIAKGMPFRSHKVVPKIDRSFWVNMIGRGYPAPSRRFRWCTERLKIEPANEFILDRVAEFGEVIMLLGVRSSESATRAQVISFHSIKGSRLARHTTLPNAFVYAPIVSFTTDDVWTYLLQNESPWGNDNRDLVAMYRNAQAGECPLVVDTTTPSCGNSRFGCWVCTVVTRDKSMEAMIDSGQEWLEPLLIYRDMLAATQDPEKKKEVRDFRRRAGQVTFKKDSDQVIPGPYKLEFCRELLEKLLRTQLEVQKDAPPGEATQIIHEAELHAIRQIWRQERGDWQDSVPTIVHDVLGVHLNWVSDDAATFSLEDGALLDQICHEEGVPTELVVRLLDLQRTTQGLKRRHAIHTRIEDVLARDWRSLEEILADRREALSRDGVEVGLEVEDALALEDGLEE